MKPFIHDLKTSLILTLILVVICCGAYPLVVYAVGQLFFHEKANGSLVLDKNGTVRGSHLIAQPFTNDTYFHPRPSAAGTNGYDATASSGSNLGPTSAKLHDQISQRISEYRKINELRKDEPIPADAVTTSGSGLDPHISIENAQIQARRVARARNTSVENMKVVIKQCTEGPDAGLLGKAGVNVLELNRILDKKYPHQ